MKITKPCTLQLSCILGHKTFKITMSTNVLAISCNKHDGKGNRMFVCLFVFSLENFSLIWKRHHYRWRVVNFYLCSPLVAIEQWGFFSVSHLLWHRVSINNGHLPWHSHLLPSFNQWSCHYLRLRSVALGFEHPTFRMRGQHSNPLLHGRGC